MKEICFKRQNCNASYKAESEDELQNFKCEECGCKNMIVDSVHANMIAFMKGNMDIQSEPKLGIFWYDNNKDEFILVKQGFASELRFDENGQKTIALLHMNEWQHQKNRTISKGKSWTFGDDWTLMPYGRVWEIRDKGFVVTVGDWINKYPQAKVAIKEEFDLPDDVEFKLDPHWNIGSGWSGDKI